MADESLRSLLASFVVEVDKAGELAKGNAAVDGLKAKLVSLQASFDGVTAKAKTAAATVNGFANVPGLANAIQGVAQARAGSLFGSFGGAQAGIAQGVQQGPTRDTLNQYRGTFGGRINRALLPLTEPFKAGFKESSGLSVVLSKVTSLQAGLLALGAGATVHALTALTDHIGDIGESASRLGVTVEEFQRLDVLAKQNGTSIGALGTAFRTLAGAAVEPTKDSAAAFAKLNVSTKDAAGGFKSRQDLFFDTAGALADVGDNTQRAALAQKLFGRGALELLPLLEGGRAGLEAQREALAKLPVFTEAAVKSADELSDSWKALGPQLLVAGGPILTELLFPALKTVTEWLFKTAEAVAKWAKQTNFGSTAALLLVGYLSTLIPKLWTASAGFSRMAGNMAKAGLQAARLVAGLLILDDLIGFFEGDDTITGHLLEKIFGKDGAAEIQKAAQDILTALKELFGFIEGHSTITKLANDLGEALSYLTGIESTADIKAQTAALNRGNFKLQQENIALGGAPATIPLAPGQFGPPQVAPQPNTLTVGDTTVIVNGVNPNNAAAVSGAVSGTLGRDRNALIAPYLTGGPI